jgi:alkylglycerol monooxygenase
MDLLALAVPFFLLAIAVEFIIDCRRGGGLYRTNDAIGSLSTGILSTTSGYFTRLLPLAAWGYVLQNFALFDLPRSAFDVTPRGLFLWALAAVAWDFCYYWFHRFSHEVSILWAAHAVHHQSEDYNLTTALRQTSSGFLFGWIFYLPLFLAGFPLDVLITVNAVNLIYQFWVHTQLVGRMGVLDRILVTPSNHRVHHAQNECYIDRNYGGMFILWDRLFGTFAAERDDEPMVYGVRKPLESWNPLRANLQVYEYLWFDARHAERWRDRLGIWFRRTGWRPADVQERYPWSRRDPRVSVRYDPPQDTALRRYLLLQFTAAVALTLVIAEQFAATGAQGVLLSCVGLWVWLYSLGRLGDGHGTRFETLRIVLVNPLLFAGTWAMGTRPTPLAAAALLGLSLASIALLQAVNRDQKQSIKEQTLGKI